MSRLDSPRYTFIFATVMCVVCADEFFVHKPHGVRFRRAVEIAAHDDAAAHFAGVHVSNPVAHVSNLPRAFGGIAGRPVEMSVYERERTRSFDLQRLRHTML